MLPGVWPVEAMSLTRCWQQGVAGGGNPVESAQHDDLSVQKVSLDRGQTAHQTLPRRTARPRVALNINQLDLRSYPRL